MNVHHTLTYSTFNDKRKKKVKNSILFDKDCFFFKKHKLLLKDSFVK